MKTRAYLLVTTLVLAAACGNSGPDGANLSSQDFEMASPIEPGVPDQNLMDGIVDHYSAFEKSGEFTIQSTAYVPFNWTIDFDSNLRGRDMKSSDGKFCQKYQNTRVRNRTLAPNLYITLVRNVTGLPDVRYTTVAFPNDGGWWYKCWGDHDGSKTYHFDYSLGDQGIGVLVQGHGTAYH